MEYIYRAFEAGGLFMWIILGTLILGISIIVERYLYISVKNRIDSAKFVNRIIELVQAGNTANAVELCRASKAALPTIAQAGLRELGKGPKAVQNAFELAAMAEIPKMERRTHYLSMIANVATLLGLLGTIVGLIQSFQAVAGADSSQKAALLSAGISVAMNTTAFGLIVAIPCMVFHSYLQSKTNNIIDEINESVARIYQKTIGTRSN